MYAGKLKGGLQKLLDKRVVRNAQLWDQVEERVKNACDKLPLKEIEKKEAEAAPAPTERQWISVFHRKVTEATASSESEETTDAVDPAVAWHVFDGGEDGQGTLACFYTQSTMVELLEDGDCLSMGLETSIPPSAIAEPTQLRIHGMGPSLVSARSFLDAAEFSFAPADGPADGPAGGGGTSGDNGSADDFPSIEKPSEVEGAVVGAAAPDGAATKSAAPMPGEETSSPGDKTRQVVLSRRRGSSNASAVLTGTAREAITAALPLYLNKHHWAVAKHLLKPMLGWAATSNPLGYDKAQLAAVPFLVLGRAFDSVIEAPTSNNKRMLGLALDTACAIVEDYGWVFEQGSFEAARTFGSDLASRTKDKVPSIRVFLMHILTKRLVQGPLEARGQAADQAEAGGAEEKEEDGGGNRRLFLDCNPQSFVKAAADEGLRRVLKPAEEAAGRLGIQPSSVAAGREVAGLTSGDALLVELLQVPLSKYLFPVLDEHATKMAALMTQATGASNAISGAGRGAAEEKEDTQEARLLSDESLGFKATWPASGPIAVFYANIDTRFTEALEPLLRLSQLVLEKGWEGVEDVMKGSEALGEYNGLEFTELSRTGQTALLVQNMLTTVNADRRAAIEKGEVSLWKQSKEECNLTPLH